MSGNQKLTELFEELKTLDESLNNQSACVKKVRNQRRAIATDIIGRMTDEGISNFNNYELIEKTTRRRPSFDNIFEDIIGKVQDEQIVKLLADARSESAGNITKKVMLIAHKDKR